LKYSNSIEQSRRRRGLEYTTGISHSVNAAVSWTSITGRLPVLFDLTVSTLFQDHIHY